MRPHSAAHSHRARERVNSSRFPLLFQRRRDGAAIALQQAWRLSLADTLFLMAVPAKGPHAIEGAGDFVKVHVAQLKKLLLLIQ